MALHGTPMTSLSHGGSCIVGPLDTFLTEPVWDKEEIIYATLARSDLIEAKVRKPAMSAFDSGSHLLINWGLLLKMDFDPVGSYSRPNILYVAIWCNVGVFGYVLILWNSSMTVDTRPGVNVTF